MPELFNILLVLSILVLLIGSGLFATAAASTYVAQLDRAIPIVVIGLCTVLLFIGGIAGSRNLQLASLGSAFIQSDHSAIQVWSSRACNAVLIILTVPYLAAKFVHFVMAGRHIEWSVCIVLFFAFTNFVLPGVAGTGGDFDHRLLYPVFAMTAFVVAERKSIEKALRLLKWGLFVFLVLSLAYLLWKPGRVLAPNYQGIIPGLSSRFWGLAPHANAIGPMACMAIFLELWLPSRQKMLALVLYGSAGAVLLLSQSKTAMAAAALGLLIAALARGNSMRGAGDSAILGVQSSRSYMVAILTGVMVPMSLLILSLAGVWDSAWDRVSSSQVASAAETFTGRDVIWSAAYSEWLNNPLFGYGPSLWTEEYRASIGLNFAFHAHNQLLQTLAESGLVGLSGLILFVGGVLVVCYRCRHSTRGASLAIATLLLIRSLTEVPLRPTGLGSAEMLLIIVLVSMWRLAESPKYRKPK